MLAPSPQATPADFVKKWTLRFADNSFQLIREKTFREFAADVATVFGTDVATVPEYQPGLPYQKGYLVRYTPAGGQESFYYALVAGTLAAPGPGNLTEWKVVPGPVSATALWQPLTLVQAVALDGNGVKAGRKYQIDFGPDANGDTQYVYLEGLDNYFDTTRGVLEIRGGLTAIEQINLSAGTWQLAGQSSGQPATAAYNDAHYFAGRAGRQPLITVAGALRFFNVSVNGIDLVRDLDYTDDGKGNLLIDARVPVKIDEAVQYSYLTSAVQAAGRPYKAGANIDISPGNEISATGLALEDGRFDLLTPDDRAVPESELHTRISWNCEPIPANQTVLPGHSYLLSASAAVALDRDMRPGDIVAFLVSPDVTLSRIVLKFIGGTIDGLSDKRYLPGTAVVFRHLLKQPAGGGNPVKVLETIQETSPKTAHFRGAFVANDYYIPGDIIDNGGPLLMRLVEGAEVAFDPTKWVGGGASGPALRTTAQDDAFVDPTYNIAASYLNTALTIRTYAQASVAVTLPALTSADVPALLRIEHQSGIGGTTCLLTVPGLARPLRVGDAVQLAATATPGVPANQASGAPAIPPGTAWVVLSASAQQLEPLTYPVMVATRSLGYAGYSTLEAAALGAPFRPIVVNVPQLVISQDVTLTSHLYAPSLVQIRIEDGKTVTLSPAIRLHNIQFLRDANGTGKVILASNASAGATPDANQAVQLIDSRIGPNLLFSAVSQAITLRGQSALDNATGSPGTIYLYDTATAVVAAGGPTMVDRRPGTSTPTTTTTLRPSLRVSNATSGISNGQQQQAIANITFTKVTGFTAVEREVGSTPGTGWDSANQRYLVPVAGEYQVGAVGQLQPGSNVADAVFYLMVYVNSQRRRDLFLQGCPSASAYYGGSGTTDLTLQAGDIVEIYAWQNGGNSQLIQSDTRCVFSIRQLPS